MAKNGCLDSGTLPKAVILISYLTWWLIILLFIHCVSCLIIHILAYSVKE